ncbi:MAG: carboxylating nicotinate-nucleotide diphosphorylase [Gemmatimonadota bacterium]
MLEAEAGQLGRQTQAAVEAALWEDLGSDRPVIEDDVTSALVVDPGGTATAAVLSRQAGVIAGAWVAVEVFRQLGGQVELAALVADGEAVDPGQQILQLGGPATALLAGERTALNFLQRLSGVATLTRRFVDQVAGTGARITDTRKTTPGLRWLEKRAVRLGGGVNHRLGLYDAVLIKENHAATAGGVVAAVARARAGAAARGTPDLRIMVEARTLAEVQALVSAPPGQRPDRILLDNMAPAELGACVAAARRADRAVELEATGGVSLDTVRAIAGTGVDLISVGALTHSAPALDLSMLFEGALQAPGTHRAPGA